MRKVTFLLFLSFVFLFALNASTNNVTFTKSNKVDTKFIFKDINGKEFVIDENSTRLVYKIDSEEKIRVEYNSANNIAVDSIRIRYYLEGEYKNYKDVELDQTDKSFVIGDADVYSEVSIEPVIKWIPIELSFDASFNGKVAEGTWKVNGKQVNGSKFNLSPLSDYTVMFEYNSDEYYIEESSPNFLAESDGKVYFSLQQARKKDNNKNYVIKLKKYSSISLGKNANKFKKLTFNGQEYTNGNLSELKMQNGDQFTILTEAQYVVSSVAGMENLGLSSTDEGWLTTLQIADESKVYKLSVDLIKTDKIQIEIKISGNLKEKKLEDLGIKISADKKELEKGDGNLEIDEQGILSIFIPRGESSTRYGVKFSSRNTLMDEKNSDDILNDINEQLSYDELKDKAITKIEIIADEGFRVPSFIDSLSVPDGVQVEYLKENKTLHAGDFLVDGDEITIKINNLPEDYWVKFKGEKFSNKTEHKFKISKDSSADDFNLEIDNKEGFWFDLDKDLPFFVGGRLELKRNSESLRGKVFLANGDQITISGQADEGFVLSFISIGSITISDEKDKDKICNIQCSFTEKDPQFAKLIKLEQPKYGKVTYYTADGEEIEGSQCKVYVGADCKYIIQYSYDSTPNGFKEPEKSLSEESNKTAKVEGSNKYQAEIYLTDFVTSFCALDCEEKDERKTELIINLDKGFFDTNKDLEKDLEIDIDNSPIDKLVQGENQKQKIDSTKDLEIKVGHYTLKDGEVLEARIEYKKKEKSKMNVKKTEIQRIAKSQPVTFKINEHIATPEGGQKYDEIKVSLSIVKADKYEMKAVENANVSLSFKDIKGSCEYLVKRDSVHIQIEAHAGFYIENDNDNDGTIDIDVNFSTIDNLNKKITDNVNKVKKYVYVYLENIHPQKGEAGALCYYTKDRSIDINDLEKVINYGGDSNKKEIPFKQGESLTIILENIKGYTYAKGAFWKDAFATFKGSVINKVFGNDNLAFTITISEDLDGKTLTLKDFFIVEDKK